MRFFAFLTVFFFHGVPSPLVTLHVGAARAVALAESIVQQAGENGVGLFFLLSAYLITELLRREKQISGSIHLKMFYIRRALRIWPLYYAALGVGLLFGFLVIPFHLTRTDTLTYVFFLKNWDIVYRGWNWNPIYILWTVSAEEQFYLAWPFAQKVLTRKWLISLCCLALLVIPLVVFRPDGVFVRHHVTQQIFLFIYFPIGSLISLGLNGRRKESGTGQCLALAAAGSVLWLLGAYLVSGGGTADRSLQLLVLGRLVIVVGTLAMFLAFFRSKASIAYKPLVYLGKISFGLYVFHAIALYIVQQSMLTLGYPPSSKLIYIVVRLVLAMALTLAAAVLSYEFYEKRFLVLKDRFAVVHSRAV